MLDLGLFQLDGLASKAQDLPISAPGVGITALATALSFPYESWAPNPGTQELQGLDKESTVPTELFLACPGVCEHLPV